jgi:ketosteroid isomerase-like protein
MLTVFVASGWTATPNDQKDLLKTREAVWRFWFAGDTESLKRLVPADTIAISSGEEKWHNQAEILQQSAQFHASGGKLLRLEFPRTEVRRYGNVAILYSQYLLELETGGKQSTSSGRVTEVFVLHDGMWTNPGWHTDSEK